MAERNTDRNDTLSRRRVLRRGTILAAAGAVGIPALTGTATATNACPRSPEYWKEHIDDALDGAITIPIAEEHSIYEIRDAFDGAIIIPPAGELSFEEIQSILEAPASDDTVNIMARQYVATYLNLLQRPETDPACTNRGVSIPGLGTVEWEAVKNSAQRWLQANGWDGSVHSGHRSWTPWLEIEGISGTANGELLKDVLDAFNNTRFEELECDCIESESDSTVDALDTGQPRTGPDGNDSLSPSRRPLYVRQRAQARTRGSGHAAIDGDSCTGGGGPRTGHPWCRLL